MTRIHTAYVIEKLLSMHGAAPGTRSVLTERKLIQICETVQNLMMDQSMLLELPADIFIVGDIHGNFHDLLRIFDGVGFPPASKYLFLGDYIDDGPQSIEVISLLFCYKIQYPNDVFLLRGNHEIAAINREQSFYNDCLAQYSMELWIAFNNCFNYMPVAAIVANRIFCCHGGLSPELDNMNQIREIIRPNPVEEGTLLCDLLWADPVKHSLGWGPNPRGVSFTFGPDILVDFLYRHEFSLMVRAHQCFGMGYDFVGDRQLITLFSATNYGGSNNMGNILLIRSNFHCTLYTLYPEMESIN